jgi:hypothetical protein
MSLLQELGKFSSPYWALPEGDLQGIIADSLHYRYQAVQLNRKSEAQYAAMFNDDGPRGEPLPVLVQVPDLSNFVSSYRRFLDELNNSKLRLEKVSPEEADEIFVDRVSEFVAAGKDGEPPVSLSGYSASTTALTVVNSNRSGDTVLYAKGYFLSTGTAFGISTPATGQLSSGRYSFGIMESAGPKFEGIVWTCPATVRLKLP